MDKMLLLNELSKSGFYDHAKIYHQSGHILINVTLDKMEGLLQCIGLFAPIPDIDDHYNISPGGSNTVGAFVINQDGTVLLARNYNDNIRELVKRRETESQTGPDTINLLKIDIWYERMMQANVFIKQHLEEIVRKLSSLEGIE